MKKRTNGFLSKKYIDQEGEIFDYIAELHEYLWKFVRAVIPGASGNLKWYLDKAIDQLSTEGKIIMEGIAKDGYIGGYENHDEDLLFGVYGELKKKEGKPVKLILQIDK